MGFSLNKLLRQNLLNLWRVLLKPENGKCHRSWHGRNRLPSGGAKAPRLPSRSAHIPRNTCGVPPSQTLFDSFVRSVCPKLSAGALGSRSSVFADCRFLATRGKRRKVSIIPSYNEHPNTQKKSGLNDLNFSQGSASNHSSAGQNVRNGSGWNLLGGFPASR